MRLLIIEAGRAEPEETDLSSPGTSDSFLGLTATESTTSEYYTLGSTDTIQLNGGNHLNLHCIGTFRGNN